jgi:hypothetical protein
MTPHTTQTKHTKLKSLIDQGLKNLAQDIISEGIHPVRLDSRANWRYKLPELGVR